MVWGDEPAKDVIGKTVTGTIDRPIGSRHPRHSMPDYGVRTMRFADDAEQSAFFDIFGATAMESIATLIGLLDDRRLAKRWGEVTGNE